MFGWIKRLGREQDRKPYRVTAEEYAERLRDSRQARANLLRAKIATAKRQKKKHSHLAAELARLEKDSTQ